MQLVYTWPLVRCPIVALAPALHLDAAVSASSLPPAKASPIIGSLAAHQIANSRNAGGERLHVCGRWLSASATPSVSSRLGLGFGLGLGLGLGLGTPSVSCLLELGVRAGVREAPRVEPPRDGLDQRMRTPSVARAEAGAEIVGRARREQRRL